MRSQLAERRDELENVEVMLQMEIEKGIEDLAGVSRQVDQSSRQMKALVSSNSSTLDAKISEVINNISFTLF